MSLQLWLPLLGNVFNQGLADATITNNGATVDGTGKIGKCYSFDGSDDYIQINCQKLYTIFKGGNQPFSIAFWVYHADSTRAIIFGDYGLSGAINFNIELTTNHRVRFYWAVNPDLTFSVDSEVALNGWTHICIVYNGLSLRLFKNGSVIPGGYNSSLASRDKTSGVFYLGRDSRTGTTVLNGKLNDFRIYDHCLTPKEVKELSKALVIHYKLDNSGFGKKNLIQESMFKSDPWKSAILETLDLDGKAAMRVSHNVLYSKTSKGTTELFPGMTYEADTQYTFSVDWRDDYRTDNKVSSMYLRFHYSDDTVTSINSGDLRNKHYWTHRYITSTAGKTVTKITTTYDNGGSLYMANVKLEKGAVDTGYAPNDDIPIYDCSGYNHDTELEGSIDYNSDSARYSKSIDFKGTSCIKSVPFYYDSNIWSVSFWYYEPINPSSYEGMFSFSKGDGSDSNKKIAAMPNSGRIWYKGESGSKSVYYLKVAEWALLTMTCDGTTVKIYQNAVQVDSFSAGTACTGRQDFVIGKRAASAGAVTTSIPYKGRMSDFRMYATCLSANDILELYNTTASADRSSNLFVREAVEE